MTNEIRVIAVVTTTISIAVSELKAHVVLCCNCGLIETAANRIRTAQPRPITSPRIADRGEIELRGPLEYLLGPGIGRHSATTYETLLT